MKFDENVWTQWNKWMCALRPQVQTLLSDARKFNILQNAVNDNLDNVNGTGYNNILNAAKRWYGVNQAVTVRKVVKGSDSISLFRILDQIEICSKQITLDFYRKLHPIDEGFVDWPKITFTGLSDDGVVISSSKINGLKSTLNMECKPVMDWVDKRVVHYDVKEPDSKPIYRQLDSAIVAIHNTFCAIGPFITTIGSDLLDQDQDLSWANCFKFPIALK